MQTVKTITTQTEAVNFLVSSCGVKQNWAKAMVLEFYTFEHAELLQTATSDELNECVAQSEQEILDMYKDWLSYGVKETAEGITFDSELQYTLDGEYFN